MSRSRHGTLHRASATAQLQFGKGSLLLKIADGVRSTHERGGAVVLDIHQGQMFTLNIVGSKILGMMELGWPETKIVDAISSEFGIRSDIVARDVREFLECLQKHRLVESHSVSDGV
jgi:Coenzyme PQQ synthesis protein D (PqqD)